MKLRCAVAFLLMMTGLFACKKDTLSPIPSIRFISMTPDSVLNAYLGDSLHIDFYLQDGDADLGTAYGTDIYVKDSRYDTFASYAFPGGVTQIENPQSGIEGTCDFVITGGNIFARDSAHAKTGDTLHYELYIMDQAGHSSNHITTPDLYIKPR